ncbi:MAG: hypothetical protein ABI856_12600 [Nitrospira sp.]
MQVLYCAFALFSLLGYDTLPAAAHGADEVQKLFDRGPIPKELLEATKNFDATAGMNSVREEAHAKQHHLLEAYTRAAAERKCREAEADIGRLDTAIVDFRDQGNAEEEHTLRQTRDERAAFLAAECASAKPERLSVP